jgi:hypothetical protein
LDLEIKKLLAKQQTLKGEKRLKSLRAITSGKFGTREELATSFGIHRIPNKRQTIKSISRNHHFMNAFNTAFNN